MKEFFHTVCPTGKRADNRLPTLGGYGVRAMSLGLAKAQLDAAVRVAGCEFPRVSRSVGSSIARLAFLRVRDGQRLLLHSVAGGTDEVNRSNTSFTHVILELPDGFDASDAIRTWGSADWREAYDGAALDLAGEVALPSAGGLDGQGLTAFLANDRNRDMTTYSLAAVLALPPAGKLFLYAQPEAVAWVVYALTLALPAFLQKDLTFSTYEQSVLAVSARLVGTWGDTRENDLPRPCYDKSNAAYHAETGRTGQAFDSPYARLAVAWLASGDNSAREQFIELCATMKVGIAAALDDLAVLEHQHDLLTPERVRRLLAQPATAGRAAEKPAVCNLVLAPLLGAGGQDTGLFPLLVQSALSREARLAIVDRIEDAALAEARADHPASVPRLLALLRQADAARANQFGDVAFRKLDPTSLSWPVRKVLLPLLRDCLPADHDSPGPWLTVDGSQVLELCDLRLPEAWENWCWAAAARQSPIEDPSLVRWLADRPARLAAVSRLLEADGDADGRLAVPLESAKADILLQAFEKDGGRVPQRVCDRILADRDSVRALLARSAAVRARLNDRADALNQIVIWAIEQREARHLLEPLVLQDIGAARLETAFADAGWTALQQGNIPSGQFALETVCPKLDPAPDRVWSRLPQLAISEFPPPGQEYLVRRLRVQGDDETLKEWIPKLAIEVLPRLLTDPKASDAIKKAAFQCYCLGRHRLPDRAGLLTLQPAVIADLLTWLMDHAGEIEDEAATTFFAAQVSDRPDIEEELRQAVFERAKCEPDYWPLADRYLGFWLDKYPTRLLDAAEQLAQPIAEYFGCTPNIHRVADALLDTSGPAGLAQRTWQLLETIERNSERRGLPGGTPKSELVASIRYQRLSEQEGDEMGLSRPLWALIPHLGVQVREKRIREQIRKLSGDFLAMSQQYTDELANWLNEQLDVMVAGDEPNRSNLHNKSEALERLLKEIRESAEFAAGFWSNARAVAACFAVGLRMPSAVSARGRPGYPVAVPEPDEAMARILQDLVNDVRRQNGEDFFMDIARCTSTWPDDLYDRWKLCYRKARDDRAIAQGGVQNKRGNLGSRLWGRAKN